MSEIRTYYDHNTRSFLRFGKGRTRAIHRALCTPEVTNLEEAYHAAENRILAEIERAIDRFGAKPRPGVNSQAPIIADLGCGVGASIAYLASRLNATIVGVTISPVQAELARDSLGPAHSIATGDFASPGTYEALLGDQNLTCAYMIESWNHAVDPQRLLETIAGIVPPGGLLAICDDFPRNRVAENVDLSKRDRGLIADFRRGWHVETFLTVDAIEELAREHGFMLERSEDLSSAVLLDRPRDRLIRVIAELARAIEKIRGRKMFCSPWWDNIRGGDALQQLEKRGLMSYKICYLRRT